MLEATKALGLGFRAHVKTHKVCHLGSINCKSGN
jgi:D-serine deaminase-like pyridoxal phosphate-dependent protein